MADREDDFENDPRTVCKYGSKCYQRNPDHHKRFKHPSNKAKRRSSIDEQASKRTKMSPTSDAETETESIEQHDEQVKDSTSADIICSREPVLPSVLTYYDKINDDNLIKELFLVSMPKDFYKLFEYLLPMDPEKIMSSVNIELIGPYELLLGKLPKVDKELYLVHWRFFYDPPEFQAVLKGKGKSQFHIGYYRDSPEKNPSFLASNDSSNDCILTPMADNIFGALYLYLEKEKKRSPFTAMASQKLMALIKKWADESNYSLKEFNIKKRHAESVTKTFHGAGVVVPYDKKTQLGYRPLVETNATIKKIFTSLESAKTESEKNKILSELQPVITYANIAVDECDFGTGLEIGINLFCSGIKELEKAALNSLCSVYSLLKRDAFIKIIQAHLKHRRKGPEMSLLSLDLK